MRRPAALALLALPALLAGCGGGDEDEISVYCDRIAELQAEPDPTVGLRQGDLGGAKEALAALDEKIAEVARVAPAQIRPDIRELQDVYAEFSASVRQIREPRDALGIVGELQASGQRIQAITQRLTVFTQRNCGENGGK